MEPNEHEQVIKYIQILLKLACMLQSMLLEMVGSTAGQQF